MTTNTSMNKLTGKVAMVTGASRAVAITYLGAQTKADEVVRTIESAGGVWPDFGVSMRGLPCPSP